MIFSIIAHPVYVVKALRSILFVLNLKVDKGDGSDDYRWIEELQKIRPSAIVQSRCSRREFLSSINSVILLIRSSLRAQQFDRPYQRRAL